MMGVLTVMGRHVRSSIMIYLIKLISVFILAQTLADLKSFLTLKKQFNHEKSTYQQDKK
jgi:hypothetical protein